MLETLAVDSKPAGAPAIADGAAKPLRRPACIVMIQTQAEGAGAQEISRILGLGLAARGHEVHHVFFYRRTAAFDRQPNTFFCAPDRPRGVGDGLRMVAALLRHLRQIAPDAVVTFQHYGNLLGALAGRLTGVPIVIANQNSSKAVEPRWAARLDTLFGTLGLFRSVVVNSQSTAAEYAGHPRAYRARLVRIDHGFAAKGSTLARDAARLGLRIPPGVPLLGGVGRLHPVKNFGAAIRLLAREPAWHLALAGQGPAREELVALAAELGVSARVHFTGELSPDAVGTFLRALDVFVFPSVAETFGLAVVEAAEAGIPVVANDLEVLHEVLAVDGDPCALFVDANHTEAFAAAVARLFTTPSLRTELTARGRGLAARYSLEAMVDRYADLLAGLGVIATTGQATP